jgi:hypothetical protein
MVLYVGLWTDEKTEVGPRIPIEFPELEAAVIFPPAKIDFTLTDIAFADDAASFPTRFIRVRGPQDAWATGEWMTKPKDREA